MKHIARWVLLFVFLSGIQLSAQIRLGPIGGFNFNNQVFKSNTYKYDGVFKTRLSYNLGIISDFILTKNLSIQPELTYAQRGGHYKTELVFIDEEFQDDLGYINLPVTLTWKFNVQKAYLFLGAGPYMSKLIYNKHRYVSNGIDVENGKMRVGLDNYTDQIKPWDFGVKIKGGFELKKGMYVAAFYDIGAYDINPQFTVIRNKTFGVQLGYLFSLTEEDRYNRFENFYEF